MNKSRSISVNANRGAALWDDIMLMFGRTDEDEVWDTEQFILTEEQARKLGLLK